MTEIKNLSDKSGRQSKYRMLSGLAFLMVLVLVSSTVEYRQNREDFLGILRHEGKLVSRLMLRGGRFAMAGDMHLRKMSQRHLKREAELLRRLEKRFGNESEPIRRLLQDQDNLSILLFDGKGNPLEKNRHSFRMIPFQGFLIEQVKKFLMEKDNIRPLKVFRPEQEGIPPGAPPPPSGFLIRRSKDRGVIVLIRMPSERPFGVQNFIRDLVENENVEYVIFHDNNRLIATMGLPVDSSILARPKPVNGAIVCRAGNEYFEYAATVSRSKKRGLTVRVGFSVEELKDLESRLLQRVVISSIVFLLLAGLGWVYILNRQRLEILSQHFRHYQTYTGNILQNMIEGVVAGNQNGEVTFMNNAARKMLPDADKKDKRLEDLFTDTPPDISTALQQRLSFRDKIFPSTKNGSTRRISMTATLISENVSDPTYVLLLRDVTELQALQEQMQRQDKLNAMGKLASGVAHEIRNPLNAIGMIAQRLNREFTPTGDHKEYDDLTRSMRKEVLRVNEIVESFLRFTRPPKMQFVRTDFGALVNEVLLLYSASMSEKNIHLEKYIEENVILELDADQMKQALINLIRNAVEANAGKDGIQVQLQTENGFVSLIITDSGPGVPEENLNKIFDLYFTTKDNGSGLGLSIVQQVVSAHGGDIRVESPVKGQSGGARFIVRLPRKPQTEN